MNISELKRTLLKNPYEIANMKQTDELCKYAIKLKPSAICYIKDQTDELCELVINQNAYNIRYINNQTPKLCELAIDKNPTSLRYIVNQTPELCKLAVSKDPETIMYVHEQTTELCDIVVSKDCSLIDLCKKPISFYTNSHITRFRTIYVININGKYLFSVGCQKNISKGEFLYRINNTDGGLKYNNHRFLYIDILKKYR